MGLAPTAGSVLTPFSFSCELAYLKTSSQFSLDPIFLIDSCRSPCFCLFLGLLVQIYILVVGLI